MVLLPTQHQHSDYLDISKMINESFDQNLRDFYGPTSGWNAIYILTTSSLIVLSNVFFFTLTLTSNNLRSKSSNWILLGFSVSDFLHGLAHVVDGIAIWKGSLDDRELCSLAGTFVIFTATCSLGFPFLIAADRYYKITIPQHGKFSLGHALFSDRFIIPLIVGWFCLSTVGNLPLLFSDSFGEDASIGCCGARITKVYLLVVYNMWIISIFFFSIILASVYYLRLTKWLKEHQFVNQTEGSNYTREIATLTKAILIIPLLLTSPAAILNAGQMVLPAIPMWLRRAIMAPYFLANVANPWLTIFMVRPFRHHLKEVLRLASDTTITSVAETTGRRTNGTTARR